MKFNKKLLSNFLFSNKKKKNLNIILNIFLYYHYFLHNYNLANYNYKTLHTEPMI